MSVFARRRLLAAGGALLAAAVVAVVLVLAVGGSGSKAKPPADAAARLVPLGALAYVHLSTDGSRGLNSSRRSSASAAASLSPSRAETVA